LSKLALIRPFFFLFASWGIAPERGSFAVQVIERKQHSSPSSSPTHRPRSDSVSPERTTTGSRDSGMEEEIVGRFILDVVTSDLGASQKDCHGSQGDMAVVTF
jgi:hypothetical protein